MPVYDYVCETCGAFEARRDHESAGEPLACPACGAPARRTFAAPLVRSPAGPFAAASREVRARVERSHTGEPVISHAQPPLGRPVEKVMHGFKHGHHHHARRRPWLLGH